jgi:hypothetical protein
LLRTPRSPKHLGYLGTATIQQADVISELSCAVYSSDEEPPSWFGRYWDPAPGVELRVGGASLRLHDATDADVELVRAGPHSGTFRVVGPLRDLRER